VPLGFQEMLPRGAEIQVEPEHRGHRHPTLVEPVLDLLPPEPAGVDDLLGVPGQEDVAPGGRQPEEERQLHVREILDLVAHHQVIEKTLVQGTEPLQRALAQIDFVPEPLGRKPLLVVLGDRVDFQAVKEKVGGPLFSQGQVFLGGEQGIAQTGSLLLDDVLDGPQPMGLLNVCYRRTVSLRVQNTGPVSSRLPLEGTMQ